MGGWQDATVVGVHDETARARTIRLRLSRPEPHRAGQHFVVRLTAPDGYSAQRSYSVASPPGGGDEIDLTVERLAGGEVSGFLHDELAPGDELEVRGPIGGWFVWEDGPALLVGGGSGLVPLMSMLRHARATGRADQVRMILSVRSPDDLWYRDEMTAPEVAVIYTRANPPEAIRPVGRLMIEDLGAVPEDVTAYVCGSTRFADPASRLVVEAGVPVERVRVERFGPTG